MICSVSLERGTLLWRMVCSFRNHCFNHSCPRCRDEWREGGRELLIIWREHPKGNEREKEGCFIWAGKGTGQCGKKERCITWDRKDGRWMNGIKKKEKRMKFQLKSSSWVLYLSVFPSSCTRISWYLAVCLAARASHKANIYQNTYQNTPAHARPTIYTLLDLVIMIPATAVGTFFVKCYINANSLLSKEIYKNRWRHIQQTWHIHTKRNAITCKK